MSILRSMYTGVTGINAEGDALGVIGDNIANSNTIGFKQQRGIFEDILGHSVGQNETPGAGVHLAKVQQLFTQGSLTNTGVSTDLALSGDAFFVVKGQVNGVQGQFYTRNGQFTIDPTGYVQNQDGLHVEGYKAVQGGGFSATTSDIYVPTTQLAPQATKTLTIEANLDATATTPANPWDAQQPNTTANFSTALTVYDSLGNSHVLSVYFRKTAPNTWDYHVLANGNEVTGGIPGQNTEIGTGTATFNSNGAMQTNTQSLPINANFIGATPGQALALNLGTPIAAGGSGTDGATEFASPSSVSSQQQDGYASGDIVGINVDQNGVLRGLYSNGQKIPIAEVALAKFRSNEGLARVGQNLWSDTQASGAPAVGAAGTGGRGVITSEALEQSNVDLAAQFVELIAHQRAFQANSKTISTADELLQVLVNLKQ